MMSMTGWQVEDAAGLRMEMMATSHCRLIIDADREWLIADADEGNWSPTPMKENMGIAKEATRSVPMKQEPKGFIVIEANTGIDRCCFLYLLKHALWKSHVLSKLDPSRIRL